MAIPSRKLWDERQEVKCTYKSSSTVVITQQVVGEQGYADANRQRARPRVPLLSPTPMFVKINHVSQGGGGSCTVGQTSRTGTLRFAVANGSGDTRIDRLDADHALIRAKAKMSEYEFGVTIAESKETLGMISNRTKDFLRFLRNVRSGRWSELAKPVSDLVKATPGSKRVANNWLELQFGWMPLFSDIYDGTKAYAEGLTGRGQRVGATSGRPIGDRSSGWDKPRNLEPRAGVGGTVKYEGVYNMNRLGLLNPLSIAWEAVPFSFVADWFLNIGDNLAALSAYAGLDGYYGWRVDIERRRVFYTGQRCGRPTYQDSVHYDIARTLVVPQLTLNIGWKQRSLQLGQIFSLFALVRQKL